jgi:hypothetical protein
MNPAPPVTSMQLLLIGLLGLAADTAVHKLDSYGWDARDAAG